MVLQGFRTIATRQELNEAEALLRASGLSLPDGIDTGIGFFEDGRLGGTAFLAGATICGVCVDAAHRGRGLASSLVGRILSQALGDGLRRVCIFTKANEAPKFASLGFQLVASTEKAAMLEFGEPDYAAWSRRTAETLRRARRTMPENSGGLFGAVVVNANPFTLGHHALVAEAAARCAQAVVFVVEEDASSFPFGDRLELVRRGASDLENVVVVPGGPYMVSRASFPAYFSGREAHAEVHAEVDARIFAARIAPDMGIGIRFVGSEPYCPATATYNEVLRRVLPEYGIAIEEMPRQCAAGEIISASEVRRIMRGGDLPSHIPELERLVPPSTLQFLLSDKGRAIAEDLRGKTGRH
jgi:[citrate (pro-3S)-lyase] ligase